MTLLYIIQNKKSISSYHIELKTKTKYGSFVQSTSLEARYDI